MNLGDEGTTCAIYSGEKVARGFPSWPFSEITAEFDNPWLEGA